MTAWTSVESAFQAKSGRKPSYEGENIPIVEVQNVAAGKKKALAVRQRLQELYDSYDIDGALEMRDGFLKRRACCFRDCYAPKAWGIPRTSWCYDQHLRVAAGM